VSAITSSIPNDQTSLADEFSPRATSGASYSLGFPTGPRRAPIREIPSLESFN
jgi:hypothetical protein